LLLWGTTQVASSALAPTNQIYHSYQTLENNTIIPVASPASLKFASLGDYYSKDDVIDLIKQTEPEMAPLLMCIGFYESSYRVGICGDNGRSCGIYQIQWRIHNITEWCANDVVCSTKWTAQRIRNGYGWQWSTWKFCKHLYD